MLRFVCCSMLAAALLPACAPTAPLFAPTAAPQLITRQFKFTEGPAADRRGNVFFTDQPNDQIWRYGTDGKLTLFRERTGRANGLYFDGRGRLLACADELGQLLAFDPDGSAPPAVLLADVRGHRLNGPNDLWVRPRSGGIFFTDPYYQRPYWTRTAPDAALGGQRLYYLPPGAAQPVVADSLLQQPNGLIGTPDGKLLYVADIGAGKTYRYRVAPDGRLRQRELFATQGSDGMTIDRRGNVYLTGDGVTVYSPTGQRLAHLAVPAPWTSNVCFGGRRRGQLFITASDGVFRLPVRVRGAR